MNKAALLESLCGFATGFPYHIKRLEALANKVSDESACRITLRSTSRGRCDSILLHLSSYTYNMSAWEA